MELVRARKEHIPAIAALAAACFAQPWPADMIGRLLDDFTVAVGDDGAPVGYIAVSSVLDEGSIDNIAVAPEHRRRGVADALVDDAVRRARAAGLATLTLEARASNTAALALYEKHGFTEVGRRKNYYERPREDAVVLLLFLDLLFLERKSRQKEL